MFVIVFQQGPLKGRRATVRGDEATLGPGRDCSIRLPAGSTMATISVSIASPGRYRLLERSAVHELRVGGRVCAETEVGTGEPVSLGTTVFILEPLAAGAAGTMRRRRPVSATQSLMLIGIIAVLALQTALLLVFSRIESTPVVSRLDDPVLPEPLAEPEEPTAAPGGTFLDPHSALMGSWLLQEQAKAAATNTLDPSTVTGKELVAGPGTVTSAPPVVVGTAGDTNEVVAATETNQVPVIPVAETNETSVAVGTEPEPPAEVMTPPVTNAEPDVATNLPPAAPEAPVTKPVEVPDETPAVVPPAAEAVKTPPPAPTETSPVEPEQAPGAATPEKAPITPPVPPAPAAPATTNAPAAAATNTPVVVATNPPAARATNAPVRVATNTAVRAATHAPAPTAIPPAPVTPTPSDSVPEEPVSPGAPNRP